MKFAAFLTLLSLSLTLARADKIPAGTGIMYDADAGYSFIMTAPKGWMLDSSTMAGKGPCAVFYPLGATWANSEVVAYVNTRAKKPGGIPALIKVDTDDMHANGSPNFKTGKIGEVKLKKGRTAIVYQYTGDSGGNFERIAFIVETKGTVSIVISARSKAALEHVLPAFTQLLASYDYMGDFKLTK